MKGTGRSKRFQKLLTLALVVTLLVVFGLSHMAYAALVAHWTFDVAGADPTADIT